MKNLRRLFASLVMLLAVAASAYADNNHDDVVYSFSADKIVTYQYSAETHKAELYVRDYDQVLFITYFFDGDSPSEGTYTVDTNRLPGTVLGGTEFNDADTPTMWANIIHDSEMEGMLENPLFFTSGTLVLKYDASGTPCVVFDAISHAPCAFHVEINMDSIDDITLLNEPKERNGKIFDGERFLIRQQGGLTDLFGRKVK